MIRQFVCVLVGCVWLQSSLSAAETEKLPEVVEFNRDIRPILSENCFFCHGPDKNKREAKLGCAHAHKLFEGIRVELSDAAQAAGKTFPESFADYSVENTWTAENLPKGVRLHLRHEGPEAILSAKQA